MKHIFYKVCVLFILFGSFNYCYSQGMWINNSNSIPDSRKAFLHIFNNDANWQSNDGLIFPVNNSKFSAGTDQQGLVMYLNSSSTNNNTTDRGFYFYYGNNWYPLLSDDTEEIDFKALSGKISSPAFALDNAQNIIYNLNSIHSVVHNDPSTYLDEVKLAPTAVAGKYLITANINFSIVGRKEGNNTSTSLLTLKCYKNNQVLNNRLAISSTNMPNPGKKGIRHGSLSISTIANLSPGDQILFTLQFEKRNGDIYIFPNDYLETLDDPPEFAPNPFSGIFTILNLN